MNPFVIGILSNAIGISILFGVGYAVDLLPLSVVALAMNWGVFVVHAMPNNSEKFFDATGSLTYVTLIVSSVALVVSSGSGLDTRKMVEAGMVLIWCIRLGSYLLARIMKDGKDSRFDEMKKNNLRFLGVWTIQAVWCFFVALPVLIVIAQPSPGHWGAFEIIGWSIWLIGFCFEVVGDKQKEWFRADPANKGRFISTGLWAYSRHPNYFGEITMWVGLCVAGTGIFKGAQLLAWLSPVTTTVLLLKVTGVPMLEKSGEERWGTEASYRWYMEHTPCIVPALRRPPAFGATEDYIAVSK